ncbi:head-tail connector protein [Marinobacter oulmenensis]|uniref:Putative phiE125 gp8 family phage protein n=1 Tax=Marinobacter oulmenensis TaxID=643747 RepID=A0A840UBE6_9GAMM|nr:head-tail connector protein [Marinobacter oulmenensis]MBB5322332.1 putative phiE125 gp8 family phage protein [Marinobacter oulmenensis]
MITLAEAKAHLRVEHEEEDALIQSLVDAAVLNLEHETGRALRVREETLVLDRWLNTVVLPWWPVRSVVDITYVDPMGNSQALSSYALDTRKYPAKLRPAFGEAWPEVIDGHEVIEVQVEVGMDALPEDLKRAALLLVGHLYEHREAVVIGTITSTLPMAVEYLVQPHRIMRVG